jgi:HEPN domain-containing protein
MLYGFNLLERRNDMARYANIDEVLRNVPIDKGNVDFITLEKTLVKYTADVVPKSEVERLETEIRLLTENSILAKYPCCVSCSKGLILTKSLEEYDKLLADIASEVAREIFEEMQSCLIQRHWNGLDIVSFEFDAVKYAELKKKYTESEGKE